MDDLAKARRKWKRAEEAVEEAQARLTAAGGKVGANAARVAQARRELQEAEDEEWKAKRKYRKLKNANGD